MKDPVYILNPKICDKRALKEIKKHGVAAQELWSLDVSLAHFMIPRLKLFKEDTQSYPHDMTAKKWTKKLDQMIETFELMITCPADDEALLKIKKGLKTFNKYLQHLWS